MRTSWRTGSLWASALVTALYGCSAPGAPESSEPAEHEQPIVNGQVELGAEWVVAVTYPRPSTGNLRLCSGSLIAPDVVLTAKHCVHDEVTAGTWQPVDRTTFTVWVGTDVSVDSTIAATTTVTEVHTTPDVYTRADALAGRDVAILMLTDPLPPAPVAISRNAPALGAEVFIAGFGDTLARLGQKHSGVATISQLDAGTFVTTGSTWTCVGDSGGPAFDAAQNGLIGVTSIGPAGCTVSDSIYTRIDLHLELIDGVLGTPCPGGDCGSGGGGGSGAASGSGGAAAGATSGGSLAERGASSDGACRVARAPGMPGRLGWLGMAAAIALGAAARRPRRNDRRG
jgi:secreted trypsin-like serine protease